MFEQYLKHNYAIVASKYETGQNERDKLSMHEYAES